MRRLEDAHIDFDSWCDRESISLTPGQRVAAHGILAAISLLGFGRANGKTFLLNAIDRFLTEAL